MQFFDADATIFLKKRGNNLTLKFEKTGLKSCS